MEKTRLHWRSFDWHAAALACFLTRWSVAINIAINSVMIEITTKSSISVKPFRLRMTVLLLFQRRLFQTNIPGCDVSRGAFLL
jgi:hypothetical protein